MVSRTIHSVGTWLLAMLLCGASGCQINNRTQEIRTEEQMIEVSFENERAEALFLKAVNATFGQERNVRRVGFPGLSVYSRSETIAWNANCNDHLRKMDTNQDRLITEAEAQSYYQSLTTSAGQ